MSSSSQLFDLQRNLTIFYTFIFVYFVISSEAVLCPRLLPKKGVEIQCFTVKSNNTNINQPCSSRLPLNSIVKFNCKPHYIQNINHVDNEKILQEKHLLKCNRKGKWRNIGHFKNFKCHMSASGWIDQIVEKNQVVIFSLSYCGYCHEIKNIFKNLKVKYLAIELDLIDGKKSSLLKEALWKKTGMKTYPNVYVSQKHIGGYDKTYLAYYYGTLQQLLFVSSIPSTPS